MPHVIHNIRRPDPQLIAALGQLPTSTIHEAQGHVGAMAHTIRPVYPGMKCCGPACTVRSHGGDNLMLHKAICVARPGDVIVHDGEDWLESNVWGEIMTTGALQRGIAGLVTSGAVRDIEPIHRKGFPIFSRGVSMKWAAKASLGTINHPVVCAGVLVNPGDIVVGDDDGVVVIPLDRAEEVLAQARAREAREVTMMEQLQAGRTTLELLGLDQLLTQLGLTEE
ncbi:MAG: 4-carboxy-4-hydroxy-2-oxoadipate aldolase/oxaloacetate decarboxylase [Chloroflexi bacterium]|nr:4-carboxy-4-hydroxy-2-oxoadipate aldolase/oxaloacetate decarboxylase [Chloroflexota bacterium]